MVRGGFDNCGDDFEKEGFRAVEINHNESKMMSLTNHLHGNYIACLYCSEVEALLERE